MSDAYAQGIHHALTALAWATGVLTVLGVLVSAVLLFLICADPALEATRRRLTTRRLRREHTRSGRA